MAGAALGAWLFSAAGLEATGALVIAGTTTVSEVVGSIILAAAIPVLGPGYLLEEA
jgi:hypothetical protein